jgi:hypothetical protein
VDAATPVLSDEHQDIGLFEETDVATLNMPHGYKRSIASWFARLRSDDSQPTP